MIQIVPQMRILVAVEPIDFRNGIDGLARICKPMISRGFGFVKSGYPAAIFVTGRRPKKLGRCWKHTNCNCCW